MALTTIKTTAIADDAVTADKLANSINSEIAANTAKVSLGSDSVTGAKIADDAIDSEHYAAGSINTSHIAADQITGAKIADDAVGSEHIEVLDAALQFGDSVKAQFGSGNDLDIFHDGSNSYIDDTGTGSLVVRSSDFLIRSPASAEVMADFHQNAGVELYYDNSKKLETTSVGVKVTGNYQAVDGYHIYLGTGNDLDIYHDGSNTYFNNSGTGSVVHRVTNGDIFFQYYDGSSAEDMARLSINGAVELYYDNAKKFETTSDGVNVSGHLDLNSDTGRLKLGAGDDLSLYHDGSNSYIVNNSGSLRIWAKLNEYAIEATPDGAVDLYYDNSKKFQTTSASGGGIKVFNDIIMPDSGVIRLGAAAGGDLKIYHDGTDNYIYSNDKTLYINANSSGSAKIQIAAINTEKNADFKPNGAVELYYDNSKKFETVSGGATITGTCTATDFAGDGSNLTGITANHTGIDFNDDVKAKWGTGDDLEIFHDGTRSYIQNSTGNLEIQSDTFWLEDKTNGHGMIHAVADGAVSLYYDNSKKFWTVSGGAQWDGDLYGLDDDRISLGSGNDILIYHDSSNSYLKNSTGVFSIRNTSGSNLDLYSNANVVIRVNAGENALVANHNGAVELYYDNTKMWETHSSGTLMPDDKYAYYGNSGDLWMGHNSHGYIKNGTGNLNIRTGGTLWIDNAAGDETYIKAVENGTVELYYDNSKKLHTFSGGVKFFGTLEADDDDKIKLGDNADLEIYHDGSNSFIKNSTNAFRFLASDWGVNDVNNGENLLQASLNGSVKAYYDNSKKFETTSTGLKMWGNAGGDGIFEHDNTTANNDRYLEIRNARSGSSRGRTAQMMIGENSGSEGDVIVRTGAANADVSGGVRLSAAATSWSAMSDIRLKDKTGDITNALVDIAKIEPLKFTWKSDTNKTPQVGVSAQSVENVVPEAVSKSTDITLKEKGDNTEYLSVKYTELIPLCIAALQEAKTKIETLETKLSALESS